MSEHPFRAQMRRLLGDAVVDRGLAALAREVDAAPLTGGAQRTSLAQFWHPEPSTQPRKRAVVAEPLRGVA